MSFFDDFERPDSPSLGPNWTSIAGQFEIVGGTAHGVSAGAVEAISFSPDVGNAGDVTAVISSDSDAFGYASVVCRASGVVTNMNGYRFGYSKQLGRPYVIKYVNADTQDPGIPTYQGDPLSHPSNPFTIRLVAAGQLITGYINGAVAIQFTNTGPSPAGGHGGLWSSHNGENFASFGIEPAASSESSSLVPMRQRQNLMTLPRQRQQVR